MVENEANSRCPREYVSYDERMRASVCNIRIHICVRSLPVCSFTMMGNTRASVCETSNKYGSHAFSF